MPEKQPNRRMSTRPAVLSLATHLLLIVVLLVMIRPTGSRGIGEPERSVLVVLIEKNERDTEYLSQDDQPIDEEQELNDDSKTPESSSATSSPAPELQQSTPTQNPQITTPLDPNLPDASQFTEQITSKGTDTQYEFTDEDLKLIAADQQLLKSRQPVGDPISISLFGSGKLTGRTFVFVIDRSQSMGGSGLGVLFRAEKELSNAIDKLQDNHKFQIVAYHGRSVTMSERRLLTANAKNKNLVQEFISRLAAFGPTVHENGLTTALTFRPDVVVLLTDGGYPPLNGSQLKTAQLMAGNRKGLRGTEIHCLHFGRGPNQDNTNFMVELATQNNGTYRYIDVNDWDD